MNNISAGCTDSSNSSFTTTIDFAMSPAVRKESGKKLITSKSVLLRFAQHPASPRSNKGRAAWMPSSNFKFINSIVRLVEDSVRVQI